MLREKQAIVIMNGEVKYVSFELVLNLVSWLLNNEQETRNRKLEL